MKKSLLLLNLVCSLCFFNACTSASSTTPPHVANHFSVSTPAAANVGTSFSSLTVIALDASNNVVTNYSGTVHFTSTDSHAVLPANSTLTGGSEAFSATFNTSGNQTITATDTAKSTITGVSNETQVCCTAPAGTFTPTGSMKFQRIGHTATLLQNGTVLIAGGDEPGLTSFVPLASAEIYNPATGTFTSTGSMGTARVGHTATLLANGKVLIAGGNDATGTLATTEVFDPSTGSFSPANGNMEIARVGHTATLLNDGTGRVLVAGGGTSPAVFFGPVPDQGSASAELFDPNSGQFTPAGNNMSSRRIYHTATLLPNGDVLLAGGTNNGSALGDLFAPASAMFTATATGGTTNLHLAAAALQDGSALLTGGGSIGGGCPVPTWEVDKRAFLFDDSDASFSQTGEMSVSRESHTATLLPGGDVLIAGGVDGPVRCSSDFGEVATAELFSRASGSFTLTGSMETARAGHTATLLGNGQVLVVGGTSGGLGNVLTSAELFQ